MNNIGIPWLFKYGLLICSHICKCGCNAVFKNWRKRHCNQKNNTDKSYLFPIKSADYIIDLGPEGGDRGGRVVAVGEPEMIMETKESYTGLFLKRYLEGTMKGAL